jgi:hypothetical protein
LLYVCLEVEMTFGRKAGDSLIDGRSG